MKTFIGKEGYYDIEDNGNVIQRMVDGLGKLTGIIKEYKDVNKIPNPFDRDANCLFTMVSPTVRAHLTLLSRLAFAMRDPGFQDAIRRQALRDQFLTELRRVEASLAQTRAPQSGGE